MLALTAAGAAPLPAELRAAWEADRDAIERLGPTPTRLTDEALAPSPAEDALCCRAGHPPVYGPDGVPVPAGGAR